MLSHTKLAERPIAPATIIGIGPTAAMIRGVTRDIPKMPSVRGRNARPEAIGPKPSSSSMYCTARKNIDSWPPTTRPIVGQAADPAPAAQQRGTEQRVGHPALGDGEQGDQGRAE